MPAQARPSISRIAVPAKAAGHLILMVLLALQAWLAARVLWRLAHSRGGATIRPARGTLPPGCVTIVVPTLNEGQRLGRCLDGAVQQGPEVGAILVVDGGSVDDTEAVVRRCAAQDLRVHWHSAAPIPADWNGKAWGLEVGWRLVGQAPWLLTLDADTCPSPGLAAALVEHAEQLQLAALSVASEQMIDGALEGLLHPALLTTLVYRFGIPGQVATRAATVQANGQCMLLRATALQEVDAFTSVRGSRCEDVTLARTLAMGGGRIGFAEAPGLIRVRMYQGGWQTLRGWSRSLPLRDRTIGWGWMLGLLEVTLTQSLPWLLTWAGLLCGPGRAARALLALNRFLLLVRLGVLLGTARAYVTRPWSYWFSPLADPLVALALWWSALERRPAWRGRTLVEDIG